MYAILMESALFIATLAVLGAFVLLGLKRYTPLGTYWRQLDNRRRIERVEALTCPKHGAHREDQLVRLSGGDVLCPECYQETMNGQFD